MVVPVWYILDIQSMDDCLNCLTSGNAPLHPPVIIIGLPLGHGLAGDAEQHGELLLGHVARGAEVLEIVAEAHGRAFRSDRRLRAARVPTLPGSIRVRMGAVPCPQPLLFSCLPAPSTLRVRRHRLHQPQGCILPGIPATGRRLSVAFRR